ncbi:PEGA domain-containing protein [Megalodesulfovibrio paquesii]
MLLPLAASATQLAYPPRLTVWEMLFGPPPDGQRHATTGAATSQAGADAPLPEGGVTITPSAALSASGNLCDPGAPPTAEPPLAAATEEDVLKKLLCPYMDSPASSASSAATRQPNRSRAPAAASVAAGKARGFGRVFVTTEPADARVRLLHREEAFAQGMALPQGTYVLEAQREGYAPVRREIQLQAGQDVSCTLELAEAPKAGKLFVRTKPEGATVRVVNIKPVFSQGMALAPGTYHLDAFLDGYHTAAATVHLEAGEEQTVTIELAPAGPQGRLFVQTAPAGAYVRILDIAPRFRQGMQLEGGTYTLSATLPGHDSVTMQADVRPGQDTTVTMQLPETPAPGVLYVDGLPAGGQVRVMSVRPAFTQGMPLRPGAHPLEIALPGRPLLRHTVEIASGQPARVLIPALLAAQRATPRRTVKKDTSHAAPEPLQPSGQSPPAPTGGTGTAFAAPPASPHATEISPEAALATATTASGGRLFVQTEPGDADIRIIHQSWNIPAPYAEGMLLPEGMYGVSVFKDGYAPVLERVQVLAGKSTRLRLDLKGPAHEAAALHP